MTAKHETDQIGVICRHFPAEFAMPSPTTRRRFLRNLGVSAAVAPLLGSLPGIGLADQDKAGESSGWS